MFDICNVPGQEVVHADYVEAFRQHAVGEVRADETGRSCNEYSLFQIVFVFFEEMNNSEVFAEGQ